MKVKDLKEMLNNFDDNDEVFAEEKITGNVMDFDLIMEVFETGKGPAFGLR